MAEILIAGTETQASINRDQLDKTDAARGTNRNLRLLRGRIFQTTPRRRLHGLVGYVRDIERGE